MIYFEQWSRRLAIAIYWKDDLAGSQRTGVIRLVLRNGEAALCWNITSKQIAGLLDCANHEISSWWDEGDNWSFGVAGGAGKHLNCRGDKLSVMEQLKETGMKWPYRSIGSPHQRGNSALTLTVSTMAVIMKIDTFSLCTEVAELWAISKFIFRCVKEIDEEFGTCHEWPGEFCDLSGTETHATRR